MMHISNAYKYSDNDDAFINTDRDPEAFTNELNINNLKRMIIQTSSYVIEEGRAKSLSRL